MHKIGFAAKPHFRSKRDEDKSSGADRGGIKAEHIVNVFPKFARGGSRENGDKTSEVCSKNPVLSSLTLSSQ